eukprot:CAMPEP_0184680028 /NCGR_PEP_ID=MMETSP0312-20130426/2890_1 /TAXON_ID=31354 /ORGANISM="Compsopogon coeruleus, Strain SAG 36.94" /LENGTH=61 /DNA_ID=CAMNT_0027129849 /DNA_START=190 /DNA_END=372 /DNA_ORIENTATION=-
MPFLAWFKVPPLWPPWIGELDAGKDGSPHILVFRFSPHIFAGFVRRHDAGTSGLAQMSTPS